MEGEAADTIMKRSLPGFFDCLASDTARVNVLSMADVEDTYEITYDQGKSYTVHMGDRYLVFEQRNKLYVADFGDWIRDEYEDSEMQLAGMTLSEREYLYT